MGPHHCQVWLIVPLAASGLPFDCSPAPFTCPSLACPALHSSHLTCCSTLGISPSTMTALIELRGELQTALRPPVCLAEEVCSKALMARKTPPWEW